MKSLVLILALVAGPASAAGVPTSVISRTMLVTDMTPANGYGCSAIDGASTFQRQREKDAMSRKVHDGKNRSLSKAMTIAWLIPKSPHGLR
jgi:hypothetical protein